MSETSRIQSLETQVRSLKRMLLGLCGAVVLGALLAATTLDGVPDVVRAGTFEVVNADGQAVVSLTANDSGGLVQIRNGGGAVLVQLKAHPEGGTISTHDGLGRVLTLMGGNERGSGAFQTRNNQGRTLVVLGTGPAGGGAVSTEDGKGEKTSVLPERSLPMQ